MGRLSDDFGTRRIEYVHWHVLYWVLVCAFTHAEENPSSSPGSFPYPTPPGGWGREKSLGTRMRKTLERFPGTRKTFCFAFSGITKNEGSCGNPCDLGACVGGSEVGGVPAPVSRTRFYILEECSSSPKGEGVRDTGRPTGEGEGAWAEARERRANYSNLSHPRVCI